MPRALHKRRGRKKDGTVRRPALGGDLARPKPATCPANLQRGTREYFTWEASQILQLAAAGLSSTQICTHLVCTYEEYRERRRWLVANAEPGDGMLAWLEFAARSARRTMDAERVLAELLKNPKANEAAKVGCLRLLHDIDKEVLEMGYESGVIPRFRPRGTDDPGGPRKDAPDGVPATAAPTVDPHAPQFPDPDLLRSALGILVEHRILVIPSIGGVAPVVRPAQALGEAARVPPPPAP